MEIGIILILCIIIWKLFIKQTTINNTSDNTSDNIYENYKTLEITENSVFTDQEIINLFKNNNTIQISIPKNYIVRIGYIGNKIIKLTGGIHIIHKYIDGKMIYQIDIIPDYYLINNIPNSAHSVQDWELNYFSHDYYNPYNILYPYTQIKKYNYYNFPRYNQYTSKYINHKLLNNLYFHKTKKIYD